MKILIFDENMRICHSTYPQLQKGETLADVISGLSFAQVRTLMEKVGSKHEIDANIRITLRGSEDSLNVSEMHSCRMGLQLMYILVDDELAKYDELKKENERLEVEATHDYLTGLYNRRGFFSKVRNVLEGSIAEGRKIVCMYVDIDNLKMINDREGHEVGDHVIQSVADLLQEGASDGIAARVGGDEFVLFLIADEDVVTEYEQLGEALVKRAKESAEITSISTGIDVLDIEEAREILSSDNFALELAKKIDGIDRCVLKAKQLGKGRLVSKEFLDKLESAQFEVQM